MISKTLEAIEERKDPERMRGEVNMYSAYAMRGFGTFEHEIGRWMYGLELQKSLRRQANSLNGSCGI